MYVHIVTFILVIATVLAVEVELPSTSEALITLSGGAQQTYTTPQSYRLFNDPFPNAPLNYLLAAFDLSQLPLGAVVSSAQVQFAPLESGQGVIEFFNCNVGTAFIDDSQHLNNGTYLSEFNRCFYFSGLGQIPAPAKIGSITFTNPTTYQPSSLDATKYVQDAVQSGVSQFKTSVRCPNNFNDANQVLVIKSHREMTNNLFIQVTYTDSSSTHSPQTSAPSSLPSTTSVPSSPLSTTGVPSQTSAGTSTPSNSASTTRVPDTTSASVTTSAPTPSTISGQNESGEDNSRVSSGAAKTASMIIGVAGTIVAGVM